MRDPWEWAEVTSAFHSLWACRCYTCCP